MDWGKLCDVLERETGRVRTLWAFVGVLGYSRYMMVRLVWTNDVATTLPAIESMFREIGGVTTKATSDNPKCFALKAHRYDPLLNPAFQRFSAHYHFTIECLPPRDPKKKGKVERLMLFVRRLFEAYPKDDWQGLAHAQEYLDRKVSIANERRHGTTCQKPVVVFREREASQLKTLPALAFERCEVSYPTVRRDHLVRVMNKYYAVPGCFVGCEMTALLTDTQVTLYHNGKLIENYTRLTHLDEIYAIKEHLQQPWQKIKENNLHYLKQARTIGPNTARFVENVLQQGNGFVDTRRIWGILSMEKKYSRDAIDFAFNPSIDEPGIKGLSSLKFIDENGIVLLMGPPGTGKTHLAIAIGALAAKAGHRVFCTNAKRLSTMILEAKMRNTLNELYRKILQARLWIIDDWALMPLRQEVSEEIFDLLDRRKYSSAMILTSNRDIEEWPQVIPDHVLAGSTIDRIFDHAQTFVFKGDSYRLKGKIQMKDIDPKIQNQ